MSTKSTSTQYGSVAIAIHWSSATAVVLALAAGLVLAHSAVVPVPLLLAHIALGLTVFASSGGGSPTSIRRRRTISRAGNTSPPGPCTRCFT